MRLPFLTPRSGFPLHSARNPVSCWCLDDTTQAGLLRLLHRHLRASLNSSNLPNLSHFKGLVLSSLCQTSFHTDLHVPGFFNPFWGRYSKVTSSKRSSRPSHSEAAPQPGISLSHHPLRFLHRSHHDLTLRSSFFSLLTVCLSCQTCQQSRFTRAGTWLPVLT